MKLSRNIIAVLLVLAVVGCESKPVNALKRMTGNADLLTPRNQAHLRKDAEAACQCLQALGTSNGPKADSCRRKLEADEAQYDKSETVPGCGVPTPVWHELVDRKGVKLEFVAEYGAPGGVVCTESEADEVHNAFVANMKTNGEESPEAYAAAQEVVKALREKRLHRVFDANPHRSACG